ncbi:MAG: type II secretion system protein GspG [Deltaproteobacteria bacterium]|nr:type II secretion system protein GspG [Deltaproteobacteria bacterium]
MISSTLLDTLVARKNARKKAGKKQRGITLLEILIVLAIIGLVMGLLVGPAVMKAFGKSKTRIARIAVKGYAFEAYPKWATDNPGKKCPSSLADLNEYVNSTDAKDPWGNDYVMQCGENLPAGAKGIAVMSYGEDGKAGGDGDARDIKSWQEE